MSLPEWVLKYKKKGMEIRCFNDKYYAYKISSKWDKKKKRSKKITEKFLGKITKEGLIPPKIERMKKDIYVKEYGASSFIQKMNQDVIKALQELFQEDWKGLLIFSIFRFLYQSPIKNIDSFYTDSYLSNIIKTKMSPRNVSLMLEKIGKKRDKIISFFKKFTYGNEHVLFDVTHMLSHSKTLEINHRGYNSSHKFDPQINLLYMFSTDRKMPIYYRVLPGNIREIKAFKNCINESLIKKAVVIADKGFYSDHNVESLKKENLHYIIPLKRNSKSIDYKILKSRDRKTFDGYFLFEKRAIWYYSYFVNNQRIVTFLDQRLQSQEEQDYLNRIENKYDGYNEEAFFKKQFHLGTLSIATNIENLSPKKLYQYFKSRSQIEIMFDALKNTLHADRTYMRSESKLEAWMFINHLALIYYYRLYQLLLKMDLLKKYSPKDVLIHLSQIRKIRINDEWVSSEATHKTSQLLKKLEIHIT